MRLEPVGSARKEFGLASFRPISLKEQHLSVAIRSRQQCPKIGMLQAPEFHRPPTCLRSRVPIVDVFKTFNDRSVVPKIIRLRGIPAKVTSKRGAPAELPSAHLDTILSIWFS